MTLAWKDLDNATRDRVRLLAEEQGLELPPKQSKGEPTPGIVTKPTKPQGVNYKAPGKLHVRVHKALARSKRGLVIWCAAGLLGYVVQGAGWTLGIIADGLYAGGTWLHEVKWKAGIK